MCNSIYFKPAFAKDRILHNDCNISISFDAIRLRDDRGANIFFVFVLLTRISYHDKLTCQIWCRLNAISLSQTINWIKIKQMTGFVEHGEEGRGENMLWILRLIFEIIQFYHWTTRASRQKKKTNKQCKSLLNLELYPHLQILGFVITTWLR